MKIQVGDGPSSHHSLTLSLTAHNLGTLLKDSSSTSSCSSTRSKYCLSEPAAQIKRSSSKQNRNASELKSRLKEYKNETTKPNISQSRCSSTGGDTYNSTDDVWEAVLLAVVWH